MLLKIKKEEKKKRKKKEEETIFSYYFGWFLFRYQVLPVPGTRYNTRYGIIPVPYYRRKEAEKDVEV